MTARITLALLFIVPAALTYPWPSTRDRWVVGIAIAAVLILFAWWRGAFLTTMVARRIGVWRRNRSGVRPAGSGSRTTALLRVEPESANQHPPMAVIASYLDRYGLRADSVRVTSRDAGTRRATWIGLTLDATDNLDALQARSARIPLDETAEIAIRRLRDHLREVGFHTSVVVAPADVPPLPAGKETWRGLHTDAGHLAAYRVPADDQLDQTLYTLRSQSSGETWTALEMSGTPADPTVAAACAVLTAERPGDAPAPGLTAQRGRHGVVLNALHPLSVERLPR